MHDLRVDSHPHCQVLARGGTVERTSIGRKPNETTLIGSILTSCRLTIVSRIPGEGLAANFQWHPRLLSRGAGTKGMHSARVVAVVPTSNADDFVGPDAQSDPQICR